MGKSRWMKVLFIGLCLVFTLSSTTFADERYTVNMELPVLATRTFHLNYFDLGSLSASDSCNHCWLNAHQSFSTFHYEQFGNGSPAPFMFFEDEQANPLVFYRMRHLMYWKRFESSFRLDNENMYDSRAVLIGLTDFSASGVGRIPAFSCHDASIYEPCFRLTVYDSSVNETVELSMNGRCFLLRDTSNIGMEYLGIDISDLPVGFEYSLDLKHNPDAFFGNTWSEIPVLYAYNTSSDLGTRPLNKYFGASLALVEFNLSDLTPENDTPDDGSGDDTGNNSGNNSGFGGTSGDGSGGSDSGGSGGSGSGTDGSGDTHVDVNVDMSGTNNRLDTTIQQNEEAENTRKGIWETLKGIPNAILDGMKNLFKTLFIPSDEFLTTKIKEFTTKLEEHLGFLAFPVTAGTDLLQAALSAGASSGEFPFPEIAVNMSGTKYVLMEATTYDLNDTLGKFSDLKTWLHRGTSLLLVVAIARRALSMWNKYFGMDEIDVFSALDEGGDG